MDITILGAGTWGTALAAMLCKNGHRVTLWSAIESEIEQLKAKREHKNLPGVTLPEGIEYTADISTVGDAEMVLFVVPSEYIRATAEKAAEHIAPGTVVVTAAKGIERGSLMTMTEVIAEVFDTRRPGLEYKIAALSGPTHAEEVAAGLPTSIVSACCDEAVSREIAGVFANSCMRVYTNTDVRGVEIAGALKNIIAIAAGVNHGMGYGDNSRALLITRGVTEITRLGVAMGCEFRTFMGLAGIGDLIVTCTSKHSRNNRCGELIGRGMSYERAQQEIGMVVEGYHALEAAMELSKRYNVEMPITEAVYGVIKKGVPVDEAIRSLMQRDLKSELNT